MIVAVWAFLAVAVPLVLTPGASTAVVLRNSLSGGTRAGLATALGANTGSLCYGLLCAFGFSIALQRFPAVWTFLRVVGCAFLAWLGGRSLWRAARPPAARIDRPRRGGGLNVRNDARSFRDGFVTNVSNPALATFYFVVLPQFIPRGMPIVRGALLLTIIHVTLAASWHAAWAAAAGTLAHALLGGWPRRALDATAGVALLSLAVRMTI
jgi:threonine/homoserine/homoserine lactone efflux protein